MKTVLILMDSLNRHMLNIYNAEAWVKTPNIDRLAKKSVIFDNHWVGSAPCMPARRDIFTGRLNFLDRNWGPIEPFDVTLQEKLREKGIFSHIITDHHHYFEIGGENYCNIFDSYDFQRGQEYDPWISRIKKPEKPKEYYGMVCDQYELNREKFVREEDYSGPRVFQSACDWLEHNKDEKEFFLMIEAFDPHEPFDAPGEYLELYGDGYCGPRFDWPSYQPVTEPPEAIEHLRKRYAANLTMIDKWLGKFFDVLDRHNLWDDALVVLTTDHGHFLGEHGFLGKGYMHMYNELAHIPLLVHMPGDKSSGKRVNALTQNIDVMPTILDFYDIEVPARVRGQSLFQLLDGGAEGIRESAIFGFFGAAVNITNGKHTYFRAPVSGENRPLNIYTAMPTTLKCYIGPSKSFKNSRGNTFTTKDVVDDIATGHFLGHTNYPVYRIPRKSRLSPHVGDTLLFDIEHDYGQNWPLSDDAIEREMIQLLAKEMKATESPRDQFERLGLDEENY